MGGSRHKNEKKDVARVQSNKWANYCCAGKQSTLITFVFFYCRLAHEFVDRAACAAYGAGWQTEIFAETFAIRRWRWIVRTRALARAVTSHWVGGA